MGRKRNKQRIVKAGAVTRRERFDQKAANEARPFRDWKIDSYTARSPDGHCLWLANGFSSFSDYDLGNKAFLKAQNILFRWRVWRMIRHEIRLRAQEAMGVRV